MVVTGMGRLYDAKERVGVTRPRVQTLVQSVGKQMYAFSLHTQKRPVSRDRSPIRSETRGGLGVGWEVNVGLPPICAIYGRRS